MTCTRWWKLTHGQNNSCSDIDKIFPDALRDPILRKVQFSDISRIDELVSFVFDVRLMHLTIDFSALTNAGIPQ